MHLHATKVSLRQASLTSIEKEKKKNFIFYEQFDLISEFSLTLEVSHTLSIDLGQRNSQVPSNLNYSRFYI